MVSMAKGAAGLKEGEMVLGLGCRLDLCHCVAPIPLAADAGRLAGPNAPLPGLWAAPMACWR